MDHLLSFITKSRRSDISGIAYLLFCNSQFRYVYEMVVQYPVILKGLTATSHLPPRSAQRSCTQAAQGEILSFPSEMVPLFQKELRTREGGKRKQTMRSGILIKNSDQTKNTLLFATYHTSENQIVVSS